jgi:hypothetical protein
VLMVLSCHADLGALLTVKVCEHLLALASDQGCWFVAGLLQEMLFGGIVSTGCLTHVRRPMAVVTWCWFRVTCSMCHHSACAL